jgi:hypothetical protein
MTKRHDNEEAPAPVFESGDLKKDHQSAKEDVNRAAVHVTDSLRLAFARMGNNAEKRHVAAMRKIAKNLQSVLDDVNALATKEEKAEQED